MGSLMSWRESLLVVFEQYVALLWWFSSKIFSSCGFVLVWECLIIVSNKCVFLILVLTCSYVSLRVNPWAIKIYKSVGWWCIMWTKEWVQPSTDVAGITFLLNISRIVFITSNNVMFLKQLIIIQIQKIFSVI